MSLESLHALVAQLTAEGYHSVYLERLKTHLGEVGEESTEPKSDGDRDTPGPTPRKRRASDHEWVEAELRGEMASSLGRAGARVDAVLLELELLARAVQTKAGEDRSAAILRHNERRQEALEARRDLIVQREALGIRDNSGVVDHYPVPSPIGPDGEHLPTPPYEVD
ncbi:MAG: hypothetical protein HY791_10235 [Deltaproteobacteria bacterium]|nr:hypothetical protein [Deltaproteobacteria bacterium]